MATIFKTFLTSKGVEQQLSILDHPQQNGHCRDSPVSRCVELVVLILDSCYDHAQLRALSGRSGRVAALQLNSGRSPLAPVALAQLTSVKHDTWSIPHSLFTTPRRLPCSFVSSPCTCYIHHLVSFSLDLVYFTRT